MNVFASIPQPNLEPVLYIGAEKNKQVRICPVPPDNHSFQFFPCSTRSFVYQISHELGGCEYSSEQQGHTMGQPVFTDMCKDPMEDFALYTRCHMLSGWTRGETVCGLWNAVASLCQNDTERNFLHQYLSLVKDRIFPMLIPQVRIGITERRRPDFVIFIPEQSLKYEWYAIELDGGHTGSDDERNKYLESNGYHVESYRPGAKGYLEEVRRLLEWIEYITGHAEEEGGPSNIAVERAVRSYESAPF